MSERYLCLHCWRSLPRERAFYRCGGCAGNDVPDWMRPAAGSLQRFERLRRPWYRRLFAEETAPTRCPKHPDAELQLFCECRYPLGERAALGRGAPLALGVAGPRSSGKTLFLVTLMDELRRREIRGRKLGIVGLDDTEERFARLSAGFFESGAKPHATPPVDEEARAWDQSSGLPAGNFAWTIAVDENRRRPPPPMLLAVNDLGGETWGLPGHVRRELFDRYLGHVGSLVFLIDGTSLAADLGKPVEDAWDEAPPPGDRGTATRQWFARVLERLGRRARRTDLALVVSKADVLWDDGVLPKTGIGKEMRPEETAIERVLFEARRRDVVVEARRRFRSVRLFAVSSLGFRPQEGDVDGKHHLLRPPAPSGVVEPVAWLLAQRLPGLRR